MGGRRKSRRKPPPKKSLVPLETVFTCPICHEEKSVTVKIDHKERQGLVACTKCNRTHAYKTNALSRPVDVYGDWIDDLTALQKASDRQRAREQLEHGTPQRAPATPTAGAATPQPLGRPPTTTALGKRPMVDDGDEAEVEDEMAGFIDDDEVDEDNEDEDEDV